MYGVKWRNFKFVYILKRNFADPEQKLATPHIVNLDTDPDEKQAYGYPYIHTWVASHAAKIVADFNESVKKEPPIPHDAPLDFIPGKKN